MTQKFLAMCCLVSSLGGATQVLAQTTANAATPSDAQIVKIVENINAGEIAAAKIATSKTKNKDVRQFAQKMIKEHTMNKRTVDAVAKKNHIVAENSDTATNLEKEAADANQELTAQDKATFDKTYISGQVKMHEEALATLKDSLIPSAKNAALKTFLEKTSGDVSEHLSMAKELETKM